MGERNTGRSRAISHPVRAIGTAFGQAERFVLRQKPNYRVTVTRAALGSFLMGLTSQYDSIYALALRASKPQLGAIASIGAAVSAILSPPVGWLVDRYGVKRFYVTGIGLTALSMLIYAVAPDWRALIGAAMVMAISMRFTGTGCSVLCADQLENRDRATGQNLCNALSSVLSALSPLLAAVLVTAFGGLTAQGLRPLYLIRFAGYGLILLYVAARLQEPARRRLSQERGRVSILGDFLRIFRNAPHLKRWIAVACLTKLPMAMIAPFIFVFAKEIKHANAYTLSMMMVAMVVARVLVGVPFGRLADRVGRKRVLYLLTPLWYFANIVLISADGRAGLIVAGGLWGFYPIMNTITSSMTMELVPLEHMGRWSGLIGIFTGLVTVPGPLLAGLVWEHLGPVYVFVIPIVLDLALRLPLLMTIPETLTLRRKES